MSAPVRRIRIDLAYDGTGYLGWQVQARGVTVQGTLEEALARLSGGAPVRVRGAGRTDTGVHARRQVADALVATRLDDAALLRALRRILPESIGVLALRTADSAFDARRRAIEKVYRYRLDRSPAADPFGARFALHESRPFERAALEGALARLPGRRDWTGFAGAACAVRNRVRTLRVARYDERGALGVFTFSADGFLNHMVRNLVGTLLEVATGRRAPESIDVILERRDRSLAGPTAPAKGLVLEAVRYAGDPPFAASPFAEGTLVYDTAPAGSSGTEGTSAP